MSLAWTVCIGLIGLGVVAVSATLAIRDRWLFPGLAILIALTLAIMWLTFRRESVATRNTWAKALRRNEEQIRTALHHIEKQLRADLDRNENQLQKLSAALVRHKSFAKLEKPSRISTVVEDELRRAAIPLPILRSQTELRGYLAAVVIVKDEGSYLREWLEFHRLVGVEHIYLYDNGSSDNSEEVLSHFLGINYVTRIPWSSFVRDGSPQRLAYAHALSNFGPAWRWMAFIDADEFLFPTEADALPSVLSRYEHLPAVAVYWKMFGFSGHVTRPAGLVIENFTRRAPFPTEPGLKDGLLNFKSIIDPSKVKAVVTPHAMMLDNELIGAFTEHDAFVSTSSRHSSHARTGQLSLNHYYTKSKEEFERKLSRGCGAGHSREEYNRRLLKRVPWLEADAVEDRVIQRFLPELTRRLIITQELWVAVKSVF